MLLAVNRVWYRQQVLVPAVEDVGGLRQGTGNESGRVCKAAHSMPQQCVSQSLGTPQGCIGPLPSVGGIAWYQQQVLVGLRWRPEAARAAGHAGHI